MELTDAVVQKLRSLSICVFLPFFRVGNSTPCLQVKTIFFAKRSSDSMEKQVMSFCSLEPLCAKGSISFA